MKTESDRNDKDRGSSFQLFSTLKFNSHPKTWVASSPVTCVNLKFLTTNLVTTMGKKKKGSKKSKYQSFLALGQQLKSMGKKLDRAGYQVNQLATKTRHSKSKYKSRLKKTYKK
jgi:hypothetical protein